MQQSGSVLSFTRMEKALVHMIKRLICTSNNNNVLIFTLCTKIQYDTILTSINVNLLYYKINFLMLLKMFFIGINEFK